MAQSVGYVKYIIAKCGCPNVNLCQRYGHYIQRISLDVLPPPVPGEDEWHALYMGMFGRSLMNRPR